MATNIDLFTHPELLPTVQETVQRLQAQMQIVEGFESVRTEMRNGDVQVSNILSKIQHLITFVNNLTAEHSFVQELSKLSAGEIAFLAMCFPTRRLAMIHKYFQAARLSSYMRSKKITISTNSNVYRRVKYYLPKKRGLFAEIFEKAPDGVRQPRGAKPETTAESPFALAFDIATKEGIQRTFSQTIVDTFTSHPDAVRSKLSRASSEDDMIMTLEIPSNAEWLAKLFIDGVVCHEKIGTILGPQVADAVEQSQLRKWERDNGFKDETSCVTLGHVVKLRLASGLDFANALYTHPES